MKVKIIGSIHPKRWYSGKLGEIFEVEVSTVYCDEHYVVTGASKDKLLAAEKEEGITGYCIAEEDCEVVKELTAVV
jgi:hypothetical protein